MIEKKDWDMFEDIFIYFTIPPLLNFIFYGDLSRFLIKLRFNFFAIILLFILIKVIFKFFKIKRKKYKKIFFTPFIILGLSFFILEIPVNSKNIFLVSTLGTAYIMLIKVIIKILIKITIDQKNKSKDIPFEK